MKKRVTQAVRRANRYNAAKSTGPKTPEGRKRSAANSVRHGFFCRELHVGEADRELYQALKVGILEELRPTTMLQQFHAAAVIDAAWRCELASRIDAQYVERRLSDQSAAGIPEPERPTLREWYGFNSQARRAAVKFIDLLIPQVRAGGRVPDWAVEDIKKGFGEDFYDRLVEWETATLTHLQLINNMIEKARLYDLDMAELEDNAEDEGDEKDKKSAVKIKHPPLPVVVKDPLERTHMMVKLLEEKKQQMLDIEHFVKHVGEGLQQCSEPPCRYVGWAFRQLDKAVSAYLRIVEAGV